MLNFLIDFYIARLADWICLLPTAGRLTSYKLQMLTKSGIRDPVINVLNSKGNIVHSELCSGEAHIWLGWTWLYYDTLSELQAHLGCRTDPAKCNSEWSWVLVIKQKCKYAKILYHNTYYPLYNQWSCLAGKTFGTCNDCNCMIVTFSMLPADGLLFQLLTTRDMILNILGKTWCDVAVRLQSK